jgi:pyruvate,water dikinase
MKRNFFDTEPSTKYPYYSRANACEVLPDPVSPLTWTLIFEGYFERGWQQAYEDLGAIDVSEYEPGRSAYSACFAGYLYISMSWARIFAVRAPGITPEQFDQQIFGDMPGLPPYEAEARPGDESPRHTQQITELFQWLMTVESLPHLNEDRAAVQALVDSRPDVSTMAARDLLARIHHICDLFEKGVPAHVRMGIGSATGISLVSAACASVGRPDLATAVMGADGDVDSAEPAKALWEIGRMVAASTELTAVFDQGLGEALDRIAGSNTDDAQGFMKAYAVFQGQFGFRGMNEWELRNDTWETAPALVFAAIDRLRLSSDEHSPTRTNSLAADRRAAAEQEINALLADNPDALAGFRAALQAERLFTPGRERTRANETRMLHEIRILVQELGRRGLRAGAIDNVKQVFMLTMDELDAFAANPVDFKGILAEREVEYLDLFNIREPFIITGAVPSLDDLPRRVRTLQPADSGTVLTGIAGAAGTATGRARVILDPADPNGLEPGDILVAPHTDPSWTPLFLPAAAVVCDVGAQISHAVVVARELGIPCVCSVLDGTLKIEDGAMISVDGSLGTVTIL